MTNYGRPRSSVSKKPTKSSLHPNGFPTFAETVAGLTKGLMNLGNHLVGAGAGIVANLVAPLTKLKESGQDGDEDSEKAYLEAVAMLRGSGSSTAETILKDLGEALGEDEETEAAPPEDLQDLEAADVPETNPTEAPLRVIEENSPPTGKIKCLECGAEFKQLTQSHLSKHGMNSQEYRKKHGIQDKRVA